MSSPNSLTKMAETLRAALHNPSVSEDAKERAVNRLDGLESKSAPSVGSSSSRVRERSRVRGPAVEEGTKKLKSS